MKDIQIRECTVKDLDRVQALQHEWVVEDITIGFVAAEKDYLHSKLGKYFLVAEFNGQIVGFVYGTIHRSKNMAVFNKEEFYVEIDDLYVENTFRRKGVGDLLLDQLLKTAKQSGIDRSLLYSSTKDIDGVIRFYKKHGYKTWNVQMYK